MPPERGTITTVLFDLDGTLVDTAPDLGGALRALCIEEGRTPPSDRDIRDQASHGTPGLLGCAFGVAPGNPEFARLRARYLTLYECTRHQHSHLFPGMDGVLAGLVQRNLPWGIVTNKPARFTGTLVSALALSPCCVVSGDTTKAAKPDPEPMHYAAQLAHAHPRECVYIGDSERDMQAGRAAGMHTLVALFGYIGPQDRPQTWQADGLLSRPEDVLSWLDQGGR